MSQFSGLNDPQLENVLSAEGVERLHEEAELAQIGYAEFDAAAYRHGDLTPVYFGSALKQFGISELIAALAKHAPPRSAPPAPASPVRCRPAAAPPDARPDPSPAAGRDRRGSRRSHAPSPCTAAHAAPAAGGTRGSGYPSSPSSGRRTGAERRRSVISHAISGTFLIPRIGLLLSSYGRAASRHGGCTGRIGYMARTRGHCGSHLPFSRWTRW